MNERITKERASELVCYCPDSGRLTWRARPDSAFSSVRVARIWNTKYAGREAGQIGSRGYREVWLDGHIYKGHRIAWLMAKGQWPDGDIDHVNGDRSDNRLCNLRDVSRSVNAQNQRRAKATNVSGLLGVSYRKRTNRYLAQITLGERCVYLGSFETAEKAHEAYLNAKRASHEGCTL